TPGVGAAVVRVPVPHQYPVKGQQLPPACGLDERLVELVELHGHRLREPRRAAGGVEQVTVVGGVLFQLACHAGRTPGPGRKFAGRRVGSKPAPTTRSGCPPPGTPRPAPSGRARGRPPPPPPTAGVPARAGRGAGRPPCRGPPAATPRPGGRRCRRRCR